MKITFISFVNVKASYTFAPRGALFRKLRNDMTFREKYQHEEIADEQQFNAYVDATFTKKFKFGDLISDIKVKPAPIVAVSDKIELIQNKRFLTSLDIWWADNDPQSDDLRVKEFRPFEVGGFRDRLGYAMPQELEPEPLIPERDLQNYPDERSWFYLKHNDMPMRIRKKLYPHLFDEEGADELNFPAPLGVYVGRPTKQHNTYRPRYNPLTRKFSSMFGRIEGSWDPIGLGLNLWAKLYPTYPIPMISPEYAYTLIGYEIVVGNSEKLVRLVTKRRKIAAKKFISKISREKPVTFVNFSDTKEVRVVRNATDSFWPFRITENSIKTFLETNAQLFGSDSRGIFDPDVQLVFAQKDWKEQNLERLEHDDLVRYPKSTRDPSNRDPMYSRRYKQFVFGEPILWEDHASYSVGSEIDEGADEFSSVKAVIAGNYFPKSRDKGHHKHNYMFSSFSKLWQREYSAKFFKQLALHFNFLKNKVKNLSLGRRVRAIQNVKQITVGTYHKKFEYLFQYSLFGLLTKTMCCDLQVMLAFIIDGLIYVNGKQVTDPFFIVPRLAIIKLAIPVFTYPIFDMLVWKLIHIKSEVGECKAFFAKFAPPSITEVSFKLGEIFFLASSLSAKEVRRQIFDIEFSAGLLHGQRFFTKQKKFGMGRLI